MELIDRKELLKAIERDSEGISGQYGDEWLFMKTIESMPICAIPALPLQKCTDVADLPSGVYRPTGEWKYRSNPNIRGGMNLEDAYCPDCGFHIHTPEVYDFDDYNYCPHCGLYIRG